VESGRTWLSEEEVRRAGVMERVSKGELTQKAAAAKLGICYRQLKRLYGRYRQQGASGLKHSNAGRRSNRAKPEELQQKVLEEVRKHYGGAEGARFGPTLAAEHLKEEHGIAVDAETLRRWMLQAGLWSRARKRKRYRSRRLRKGHFGELLQMDGSFHRWLEDRAEQGCLINLVDDATGTAVAHLAEEETTWAVADVLRKWVESYGIPRAIYTDWKSVYHAMPEQDGKKRRLSQFGQMCGRLGIELIAANSPQAKGRVERHHGTHQDRLVKKLRRLGIDSYEQANVYLEESYLPAHNARYAVKAEQPVDFHDPVPEEMDLDWVFCLEQERVVSNDWVVRYDNQHLQLLEAVVSAGAMVQVQQNGHGRLRIVHQGRELRWQSMEPQPKLVVKSKPRPAVIHRPPATHPWKRERTIARTQDFSIAEAGQGDSSAAPLPRTPIPG